MNENITPDKDGRTRIEIAHGNPPTDHTSVVEAWIVGDFAYRSFTDDEEKNLGYLITHVRTGRKLPWWFDTKREARDYLVALRDYLQAEKVDTDTKDPKEAKKRLGPHRDMIYELAQSHGGCEIL